MKTPATRASARARGLMAVLAAGAALGGCYMPRPVAHAELHISALGELSFNGAAVAPEALLARITAAEEPGRDLVVQIEAAPAVQVARIRDAVAAVKLAHARVAFAKDTEAP